MKSKFSQLTWDFLEASKLFVCTSIQPRLKSQGHQYFLMLHMAKFSATAAQMHLSVSALALE